MVAAHCYHDSFDSAQATHAALSRASHCFRTRGCCVVKEVYVQRAASGRCRDGSAKWVTAVPDGPPSESLSFTYGLTRAQPCESGIAATRTLLGV